jgi:hypothetical protein
VPPLKSFFNEALCSAILRIRSDRRDCYPDVPERIWLVTFDGRACLRNLCAPEIDRDVAETKALGSRELGRSTAAQQGFNTGHQVRHLERLDEIVVGSQPQADHAVDELSAGRKHQDRCLNPALAVSTA